MYCINIPFSRISVSQIQNEQDQEAHILLKYISLKIFVDGMKKVKLCVYQLKYKHFCFTTISCSTMRPSCTTSILVRMNTIYIFNAPQVWAACICISKLAGTRLQHTDDVRYNCGGDAVKSCNLIPVKSSGTTAMKSCWLEAWEYFPGKSEMLF